MNKILSKISYLFLTTTLVFMSSCSETLDLENDPDNPTSVNDEYLITAGEASIATIMGGTLTNLGGFWAQYHAQGQTASQYVAEETYNINTAWADRLWTELYAGGLNDLERVRQNAITSGDNANFLIAEVLQCYTFQVLVDLFGDVPYSEALRGSEIIAPVADSGRDIYLDLITRLDTATDLYESNPTSPKPLLSNADALFGGDMDKWIQFANSLKLKLYIRMSETSDANPSAVQVLLNENNFITEDVAFNAYNGVVDTSNPFYDVQIDYLGDVNNVASNSLLIFLDENADNRISAIYRRPIDGDGNELAHAGLDQGGYLLANHQASEFSRPNITPTTSVYYMSLAELYFLEAEADLRYNGGGSTKMYYEEGIDASFAMHGLNLVPSLYGTGGVYEYPSATMNENLEAIIIQKWVANAYVNSIESFFEFNRTGYPVIKSLGSQNYSEGNFIYSIESVLQPGQTPLSIWYPADEVTENPNLNQKTNLLVPAWWDQ